MPRRREQRQRCGTTSEVLHRAGDHGDGRAHRRRGALLANVTGEQTDFIRLNNNEVRQAGTVDQRDLTVDLIEGRRHVAGGITLTVSARPTMPGSRRLLAHLRDQRRLVADDPFLLYNETPQSTERIERGPSRSRPNAARHPAPPATGHDLVGIYASGDTFNGFANSLGQRNWFQSATFNLDWCFYLEADKAAKNLYAGFDWDDDLSPQGRLVDATARRARPGRR